MGSDRNETGFFWRAVHARVDKVFNDLMDLRRCVVFFDEMDALAQTREGTSEAEDSDSLDVTRLLLTTSMLPKLADLWERAGVIFLMATNHRRHLDPAITRANRFDLLLCVSPPPWSRKKVATKLNDILQIANSEKVEKELNRLVSLGSDTEEQLDLFMLSELGTFFDHLRRAKKVDAKKVDTLLDVLKHYEKSDGFSNEVAKWAELVIALRKNTATRDEYNGPKNPDVNASRRQYFRPEKQSQTVASTS
jgi:SpoVK/Ycf46/Vps4 family AAA+-type ATPase